MKTKYSLPTVKFALARISIVLFILFLAAVPAPGQVVKAARILYVNPYQGTDHDCLSWASACNLQQALGMAIYGDEIWVQSGTYKPGTERTDTFRLVNGVGVYGGFNGFETSRDQRPNYYYQSSILLGDLQDDDIWEYQNTTDNSFNIVTAVDVDSSTVLDHFYIMQGYANGAGQEGMGAGIFLDHASPRLSYIQFIVNYADSGGGIAVTNQSAPVITNSYFVYNAASLGGAVYVDSGSSPRFIQGVIQLSRADSGGGVYLAGGSNLEMVNFTIAGNGAAITGPAFFALDSAVVIRNSILWENQVDAGVDGAPMNGQNANYEVGYSLVQGGTPGEGNLDADPLFQDNPHIGLDQAWGTADDSLGYFTLRGESPAIDAGLNELLPGEIQQDLGDHLRLYDYPRAGTPQSPVVDMGSYEAFVVYVRQGATGSGDGSSWADAYPSLTSALQAGNCREMWVASGTYTPGVARGNTFQLDSCFFLYGGFAGIETDRNQRNWQANPTVLSGDIGVINASNDNVYHVVSIYNGWDISILDGFIIRAGMANIAQNSNDRGGGIISGGSKVTLQNLSVESNQAFDGGGIYLDSSQVKLENVHFKDNVAVSQGGGAYTTYSSGTSFSNAFFINNKALMGAGLYNLNSNLRVEDTQFIENETYKYGSGGGIYEIGTSLISSSVIKNVTFLRNSNKDGYGGGGYYAENSNPTFQDVTMVENDGGFLGGGIFLSASNSLRLDKVTFIRNRAQGSGGLYLGYVSNATLRDISFLGNQAEAYGGAACFETSTNLDFDNVLAVGNSADIGGGMYVVRSSPVVFRNITMAANDNAAINVLSDGSSISPVFMNSVLWGNAPVQIEMGISKTDARYSLMQGGCPSGAVCSNLIDADPLFVRNPSPGLDGEWGSPDDDYGDLRLRPGSPAIDAGNNTAVPAGVTADLAGQPRFVDDPRTPDTGLGAPPIVDMGAYEANLTPYWLPLVVR